MNRRSRLIAVIMIVLVLSGFVATGYFFLRDGQSDEGTNDDDEKDTNRAPIANAGLDRAVTPGEDVTLDGSMSSDLDGDRLSYHWDVDDSIDTNGDGVTDNDRDLEGVVVTHTYPEVESTVTFRVVLNVSDGSKWDTDHVLVTVYMSNTEDAPMIDLSCRYTTFPLPGVNPQYVITVTSVSTEQMLLNYSYQLTSPEDQVISQGTVSSLVIAPPNSTIRYVDLNLDQQLSEDDSIIIKDVAAIPEGSVLELFYKAFPNPSGFVVLRKD